MGFEIIRESVGDRFRILVLGRTGSGKTTILKTVCGSKVDPMVVHPISRVLLPADSKLMPSESERGNHKIDIEWVFPDRTGYIFHDSNGFESGSETQQACVINFILQRANEQDISARLHAIWCCIPMNNDRPTLEIAFFDKFKFPAVTTIAVFTMFDILEKKAYASVKNEGHPTRALTRARANQWYEDRYYRPLLQTKFAPPDTCVVRMEDMRLPSATCTNLLEATARNLTRELMPLILLAIQRNNLQLSASQAIESAVRHLEIGGTVSPDKFGLKDVVMCFPGIFVPVVGDRLSKIFSSLHGDEYDQMPDSCKRDDFDQMLAVPKHLQKTWLGLADSYVSELENLLKDESFAIQSQDAFHFMNQMYRILMAIILAEHMSWMVDEAVHAAKAEIATVVPSATVAIAYRHYKESGRQESILADFEAVTWPPHRGELEEQLKQIALKNLIPRRLALGFVGNQQIQLLQEDSVNAITEIEEGAFWPAPKTSGSLR